jgi:hypothetical protein
MYVLIYKCSFHCFDSENRVNITLIMYVYVYICAFSWKCMWTTWFDGTYM